jgi:chromosome segregation ATPase
MALASGFGLSALASFVRARGQNQVDAARALSESEAKFRQDLARQLGALQQRCDHLEHQNDQQASQLSEQNGTLAALRQQNSQQQAEINSLRDRNRHLEEQAVNTATRLAQFEQENASQRQQLQVVVAQKDFLERENGSLRRELERIRAKLPPRVEAAQPEEQ